MDHCCGVGAHAGAIATIIFATPPIVRLTMLGLKKVPLEVVEAALMSGCTNLQLMFKVMIPAARRDILIGVNQMIMQCLALAVIASFIYLIPVIMLFGVTDTPVLIAVIVYATIPATRHTIEGLRSVPAALQDLGLMSGTNWHQRFANIDLPLALPHIMLGINQTEIFALFMVIIGAMIGTDDLGQYILKALSEKNGIGNGLMLGLCVAFMGLAVDHVIQTWAQKQRKLPGLAQEIGAEYRMSFIRSRVATAVFAAPGSNR